MNVDRPTVREALDLVELVPGFQDKNGCCLHIVLDDDNLDDSSVEFCCRCALEREHQGCFDLAMTLRRMTRSQRGRVARLARVTPAPEVAASRLLR